MRIILDTSVIVSALISPKGSPRKILDLWERECFSMLYTHQIFREYKDVLERAWLKEKMAYSPNEVPRFLETVIRNGEMITGRANVSGLIRDPFDEMFLACARLGRADYIVSVDKDLLALGEFEGTKIVRPARFLEILAAEEGA